MKYFASILSVVAVCALCFCGCGKPASSGAKKFTVGFDAAFPPYGFKDAKTGEYRGFDLDLAAEVAKRNGWELVKKPIDWAAKDSEINAGTIDCIWNGFTITEERKEQYTWTEPYVSNRQLVLVKKGGPVKTLADLKGKAIVAQDGSSGASAIKGYLEKQQKTDKTFAVKELKLVPDYNTANTMLESGAVDAIALDSAVAEGLLEKSNGKFEILTETLVNELFGVGFKKGNTALRDQVQATLKAMVDDGTAAAILKYWHEKEASNGGTGIVFILKGTK